MALVLAIQEGRAFYADDTRVEVERSSAPGVVQLKVVGKGMDSVFHVGDNRTTEILPRVFVQVGLGSSTSMHKIVVDAPKNVRILRDSLYDAQKAPQ